VLAGHGQRKRAEEFHRSTRQQRKSRSLPATASLANDRRRPDKALYIAGTRPCQESSAAGWRVRGRNVPGGPRGARRHDGSVSERPASVNNVRLQQGVSAFPSTRRQAAPRSRLSGPAACKGPDACAPQTGKILVAENGRRKISVAVTATGGRHGDQRRTHHADRGSKTGGRLRLDRRARHRKGRAIPIARRERELEKQGEMDVKISESCAVAHGIGGRCGFLDQRGSTEPESALQFTMTRTRQ